MSPIPLDLQPNLKSESELEKWCVKLAKTAGVLSYKFKSIANRGVPDRLFIFQTGETVYVEFKTPVGPWKLSKLQKRKIDAITAQGASVYVCDDPHTFKDILRIHADGGSKFSDRSPLRV